MELRHDLQGFDKLQRAFMRAPQLVARELDGWMQVTTENFKRQVLFKTPRRDGTLQKNINSHIESVGSFGVQGIVSTALNYAIPVEFGRKKIPLQNFHVNEKIVRDKGAFMFTKALDENTKQIQDDFARFVDHVLAKIAAGAT